MQAANTQPGWRRGPEAALQVEDDICPSGRSGTRRCLTIRDTFSSVSDLISVRLDDEARRALAELEATGLSRSDAVRRGLVAAAQRLRDRQRLIDEVAELAIDEVDRAEAAEVAAMMEDLRAPG